MRLTKKMLLLGSFGLTGCHGSSIIANVKTNDCNSVKAYLPDNAGELRRREPRTTSLVWHTSPALSGFFVRRAQKGKCIVKTNETKKELEPNEPGSNRGFGCMILEKPLDPESIEGKLELFGDQVAELTREIWGEEKSIAFASGVMAGIALGKRKMENALDTVFPDDSEVSPEEEKRERLLSQIKELLSDLSTGLLEKTLCKMRDIRQSADIVSAMT